MIQSHVIEVDGVFLGAAVRIDRGYRFVAVDVRVDDLDGRIWGTLDEIRRLARRMVFGGGARNAGAYRAEPLTGMRC